MTLAISGGRQRSSCHNQNEEPTGATAFEGPLHRDVMPPHPLAAPSLGRRVLQGGTSKHERGPSPSQRQGAHDRFQLRRCWPEGSRSAAPTGSGSVLGAHG